MRFKRIALTATQTPAAQAALKYLSGELSTVPVEEADVIVALGGDGFMLETLHAFMHREVPVFGMNRGSIGFLMNAYNPDGLHDRLEHAVVANIHPLRMLARTHSGAEETHLAINEVSLLRETRQASKISIMVDDRIRLPELISDGVLLATPAGSTAYNLSAHGPILPISSELLALTPISAFRPRRWRGAILPMNSRIRFDVLEPLKRPVSAVADAREVRHVDWVEAAVAHDVTLNLLFDPGHSLEERVIQEQFLA